MIAKPGPVCFRTFGEKKPASIETYMKLGGYSSLKKILKKKTPRSEIIEQIKESGLKGRGGAGFPTGLKWSFMAEPDGCQRYLICNSDEGEPGTCKDNEILKYNPHQLLEGMIIAAYVLGTSVGYNYLRGEYQAGFDACEKAIKEARDAGFLGKNILKSGFDYEQHNILGAGSYIVGEETAMLESLEGKRAMPRNKPPFPIQKGLYDKPTVINNTESLASIPVILEKGAAWFANLGIKNSGGTKIFCVSGHVNNPGVFELPLGTPFRDLLDMAGGMRENRACKAVIPGGSSMNLLTGKTMLELNLDYDSLKHAGSAIGSGGIIVMDEQTCMVSALNNIAHFYRLESCGQCTPCREGTTWVYNIIHNILKGKGRLDDLKRVRDIARSMEGRTICVFAEAISWPVNSFIDLFYDEFAYYIQHGESKLTAANIGSNAL
jgi:NADH-quinone oxidoreductase subunit F